MGNDKEISSELTLAISSFSTSCSTVSSSLDVIAALTKRIEERNNELNEKEARLNELEKIINQKNKELDAREAKVKEDENKNVDMQQLAEIERKHKEREDKVKENIARTPDKITVSVGGQAFTTTKLTLLQQKGSFFETMINSGTCLVENGEIFIDHDPTLFGIVLNFMRTKRIRNADKQLSDWQDIHDEFKFFNVPPPFEFTFPPHLVEILKSWLPNKSFELIYKASRDGVTNKDFHTFCDKKGPTLNIIQSQEGYLFGGYSPADWFWNGEFIPSVNPSTFIFTLTNPHSIPPTKYLFNHEDPVSSTSQTYYGINFGWKSGSSPTSGWFDLFVSGGTVRISFPKSFTDNTGKGARTFAGTKEFVAKEILVFAVSH